MTADSQPLYSPLKSAAMLAGIRALAEPAADARQALERYYRSKQEGLDA